jgi:dUTP pyrophosphatase
MVIHFHVDESWQIPTQGHPGDAGWDICAFEDTVIPAGSGNAVPTGVRVEIPQGYEIQIRGRSGLAFNRGIIAHIGTIDSGYRGEIRVFLFNVFPQLGPYVVKKGDRVAQMVISKVMDPTFVRVDSPEQLSDSSRSDRGYGSTGR